MRKSTVNFLQKFGFSVSFENNEKHPDFTSFLMVQNDLTLRIKRIKGLYYFWVAGSSFIDTTSVSDCNTFPVLLQIAYDRIHGLKLAFHDSHDEYERRMAAVEDVIVSMFDIIMGEWD